MSDGFRVRHTVRVLVLDDRDRLLLFRSLRRAWWQPPGGGIEEGEDCRAAVFREIAEETGLLDLDLVAEVWRRRSIYAWHGIEVEQHERWFMGRATCFDPDTSGLSSSESSDLAEWRWWGLRDLHLTRDRLVPADLAPRMNHLLKHGPPSQPFDVQ